MVRSLRWCRSISRAENGFPRETRRVIMTRTLRSLGWLFLLLPVFALTACSDDDCPTCEDTAAPQLAYVGSQSCETCHQANYDMFIESGHPYKLNEVVNGAAPTYPWDLEHASGATVAADGPPPGTTWDDFAYVIGGFGWKARWVKPDGNVYTAGKQAQLNLWASGPEWVAYHEDEVKPYNYDCFKCHTTGSSPEGSWPAGTTGWGTFAYGGVQCEECHGQGSQHVFDPATFNMTVDDSSDLCGRCHTRDSQNRVAVSGGFIRHHEQYDEMIHSPHAAVGCGGCHDPHASVKYDDVALGDGVATECATCHADQAANNTHNSVPGCTDCHMPNAAKSARKTNDYNGDIASHTFTINTAAVGKDAMWTSDGKFVALDEFGRGAITLDFACYSCHKDAADVGGIYSQKTLAELSAKATGIHTVAPKVSSR
jgi:Cytochrome c554 and c-prime/Doubled CXXCH motif (Paired_CXXCH_1)